MRICAKQNTAEAPPLVVGSCNTMSRQSAVTPGLIFHFQMSLPLLAVISNGNHASRCPWGQKKKCASSGLRPLPPWADGGADHRCEGPPPIALLASDEARVPRVNRLINSTLCN